MKRIVESSVLETPHQNGTNDNEKWRGFNVVVPIVSNDI